VRSARGAASVGLIKIRLSRLVPLGFLLLLAACQPSSPGKETSTLKQEGGGDRGAVLYAQNCVPCHRENGESLPKVFPSLAGSPAVVGDPIELAQWVLSQKRPASIPAGRYPTQMLLFGWMNNDDAAALLTYIRSHFGNSATPVEPALIARSREK
jgi:mono/diheme cytochrome c family protein